MSSSSTPTLKALRETPTARIYAVGASAASLVELLGAVLGSPDTALAVLNQFPTLEDIARASNAELEDVAGIGTLRAAPRAHLHCTAGASVCAALELGRRLASTMPHERLSITSPADAVNLVMSEMSLFEQEQLRIILLDTRNRVQGIQTVYVVHAHPLGDPSPSPEDVALTRDAVQAGKLLSVEVLDHLVIGKGNFVSLHERGLGFS